MKMEMCLICSYHHLSCVVIAVQFFSSISSFYVSWLLNFWLQILQAYVFD